MNRFSFRLFSFRFLFLLSLVFANKALAFRTGAEGVPERRLTAAKRSHELGTRDLKGCLSHDHRLHYVDGEYDSQSLGTLQR